MYICRCVEGTTSNTDTDINVLRDSDREQRTAPQRSQVGVAPEVTWQVDGALQSLGHLGGA